MTAHYKTEQEKFWAGNFGDEYIARNQGSGPAAANLAFFSKIIAATRGVRSAIEFGANIGLNMNSLRALVPGIQLSAIEINLKAAEELKKMGDVKVYAQSILDFEPDYPRDLAFAKGVLIHIDPEHLNDVYDLMHRASRRYICVAEYYNPSPVEVPYRGNREKLFKRDFAGEMMDRFKDLRLVDYGFAYRRDPNFPQDDTTWFLMEKMP